MQPCLTENAWRTLHLQQITPSWLGIIITLFPFVTLAQLAFSRSIGHGLWIAPSCSLSHIQNVAEARKKFSILILFLIFVEVETISMISKLKKKIECSLLVSLVILVSLETSHLNLLWLILVYTMGITALLYDTTWSNYGKFIDFKCCVNKCFS